MKVTVKNLGEATAQDVFDTVIAHLRQQGAHSRRHADEISNYSGCAYRGEYGNTCAAGCLIPDEIYNETMEGKNWPAVVKEFGFSYNHDSLIQSLQTVHDCYEVEHWESSFERTAKFYGVEYKRP